MFILGHIGIGRGLATPWRSRLPALPLVVGTLLPDLIDKPLYYSRLVPFITSTRTFGHTGVLLLALLLFASVRRSRTAAALGIGVATHLLLDLTIEMLYPNGPRSLLIAVSWPLMGGHFATFHLLSFSRHLTGLLVGPVVLGEIIGLALLLREWRRYSRPGIATPSASATPPAR